MPDPQDEVVRDAKGKRIGVLQTRFDGVVLVRDAQFNKLGEYDPRTNTTRDATGRRVGTGDHLMWLLTHETANR
jgi:hypothetical protein